jgi:hypothetical protein
MDVVIVVLVVAVLGFVGYQVYRASQEESKEARTIRSLPPSVQHVVAQMDAGTQAAFFNEYERKRKRKAVGYLLWLVDFHYLYVRRVGLQFAFWFTFGGFLIWWIADLFRMPAIIRGANEQMARECLQTLHIGAAFASMPAASVLMTHAVAAPPVAGSGPVPVAGPSAGSGPVAVAGPGAGWFADPTGRHERRFWDGRTWTPDVIDAGVSGRDQV